MPAVTLFDTTYHDGSTTHSLRVASRTWTSRPADSPAKTVWTGGIKSAGEFKRGLDISLNGGADVGYGYILLSNAGGEFDFLLDAGLGRECTIRRLASESSSLASAETLLRTYARNVESQDGGKTIAIRLRDPLELLKQPFLTARYAGTTGVDNTIEGDESLIDVIKPRVLGVASWVKANLVNPTFLTYQISTGACAGGLTVNEGGIELPDIAGISDFSTIADLHAATVPGGEFATAKNLGLYRVGEVPTFPLRSSCADVLESTTHEWCAARIVQRVLTEIGFSVDTASFDTFADFNPTRTGVVIEDESTAETIIQGLLAQCGGTILPTSTGTIGIARFYDPNSVDAPDAVAVFTTRDFSADTDFRLLTSAAGGTEGVPVWSVTSQYISAWHPLSESEIAGAATALTRGQVLQKFKTKERHQASVKTQYPNAAALVFNTALRGDSAATAQADRRLGLFNGRRDAVRMRVRRARADGVVPGCVVLVTHPKFGWDAGKRFLVTSRTDHFGSLADNGTSDMVTLEVWG